MTNDTTPQVIEVQLTRGYTTIISPQDADLLEFHWHTLVLRKSNKVYAKTSLYADHRTTHYYMHRMILARMLDRPLVKGELCDHVDNDGLNNVRSNLRLASKSKNAMNAKRRSDNASGYKGVSWHKGAQKWLVQLQLGNENRYLGLFDTAELAYAAYCAAAREHFGDFARLE